MVQRVIRRIRHTTTLLSMLVKLLSNLGAPVLRGLEYLGGVALIITQSLRWLWRSFRPFGPRVRFGRPAFYAQMVRLGVRAIGVVTLVSACIGFILALQMAPPLEEFGQVQTVPNIIAVAIFRELGPLIAAVVMTGFAGAAIAAELGTMVVNEEIEALEAHALNPVRFLVVPRILATTISLVIVCVIGEVVAIGAGWMVGVLILDIPSLVYFNNTIDQLSVSDVLTGLWKAAVFGLIISSIACHNGLSVTGGASGVGLATTRTVVHSVTLIIFSDLIFTGMFYALGWH
ncbi:MAG: ABC transporter permease [Phycisphaeraceae bacterium]|nr:ABC transporter permease [Phycisphaeraceae bacterium]